MSVASKRPARAPGHEEVVLGDRLLQVLGVLWLACFAIGVHAG
jgi:hypothetical protein